MIEIDIRPGTVDDATSIAQVHYDALLPCHPLYEAMLVTNPRDLIMHVTPMALKNAKNHFLVARASGTDAIIGFIRFEVVEAVTSSAEAETQTPSPESTVNTGENKEEAPSAASFFAPKSHLEEVWDQFCADEEKMDSCYEIKSKDYTHICARHLIVHPKYQRMGVGRKLLQAVVDRGGADKLPVFVVASLESYNLCKTFGFEDLGGGVINHGRWARVIREKEEKLGLLAHGDEKPEMGHFRELKLQLVKWA